MSNVVYLKNLMDGYGERVLPPRPACLVASLDERRQHHVSISDYASPCPPPAPALRCLLCSLRVRWFRTEQRRASCPAPGRCFAHCCGTRYAMLSVHCCALYMETMLDTIKRHWLRRNPGHVITIIVIIIIIVIVTINVIITTPTPSMDITPLQFPQLLLPGMVNEKQGRVDTIQLIYPVIYREKFGRTNVES